MENTDTQFFIDILSLHSDEMKRDNLSYFVVIKKKTTYPSSWYT